MSHFKADLPHLIFPTQREHQRLTTVSKRLETYDLSVQDLQKYRDTWNNHLGYFTQLKLLLNALDQLIQQVEHNPATEADYGELIFQIGLYKKSSWAFLRSYYGSLSPYMDRWANLLPQYKDAFQRKYEPHKKLTVPEQGQLMRQFIQAIPNLGDPYNLKPANQKSANPNSTAELNMTDTPQSKSKPKPTLGAQVIDFLSFKNKRRKGD